MRTCGAGHTGTAEGRQTQRYNLAGASLIPLAFEDGGRPAEETVAFVRRCGAAAKQLGSALLGTEEGSVVAKLWQEYSTLLQWGNAELVLSANGR